MKHSHLVAVDVGVSFVKAGLYDVDGNPLAVSIKPARGEYPEPGVFLQKNQDYLATVLAAIKEVVDQSGVDGSSVAAVGLSCALGGATGVDKDWNVIFDWSIISDTRSYPWVTLMKEEAGPETTTDIYDICDHITASKALGVASLFNLSFPLDALTLASKFDF